jgi:hypothetical protein
MLKESDFIETYCKRVEEANAKEPKPIETEETKEAFNMAQ